MHDQHAITMQNAIHIFGRTQFIISVLVKAGWNIETQVCEEVYFTDLCQTQYDAS